MRYLIAFISIVLLLSCTRETPEEFDSARVVPLYSKFRDYEAADSLRRQNIFKEDSIELAAFMQTVSEQELSDEMIEFWASSQPVAVFTPDVDSIFTDSLYIGRTLGHILHKAESAGLDLPHRRYAAVVYGRPESILFVDSVMLIALNHYLGFEYPGYSHWPVFMRINKTPQALPYDLAEALVATSYPFALHDEDATLLSRMVYEGALAHAKMALVPQADLAGTLGYTDAEMKWLEKNEAAIWRSMVKDQLLYDTSEDLASRILSPAPEVFIVDPVAPGRVGRYIGYRIVEEFMKNNPEPPLKDMLEPDFYKGNSTLIRSEYNPQ